MSYSKYKEPDTIIENLKSACEAYYEASCFYDGSSLNVKHTKEAYAFEAVADKLMECVDEC